MRIAIVCPYAWDRFGGVQSHIRALSSALRARDHDVLIVAPLAGRANGVGSEDGVAFAGRSVGIPANGSVAPIAFGPRAVTAVRRALHSFRPQVLHLHEPLIPSLSLLALIDECAPSVGTFHVATEGSWGYKAARPALQRLADRLNVRTAVSDQARALIARYFPGEYVLTPNGVDTERFSSARPMDLGPGKKVLFFGRIERRKGLEVLLQAMTRVRDLEATLIVAGDGPEARDCKKLARQLQVNALFLGRIHEDRAASVFRAADVYCAPGIGGESFGIVLIEAMAAEVPVVCSDLPGFRSVARGTAELVPPRDAGLLADALRAVLTDKTKASGMRTASIRTASMFDWKRLVAGVEANYKRAVDR
jgi:phosphatidyl-myo-inositol alpha-mannosyltransferase